VYFKIIVGGLFRSEGPFYRFLHLRNAQEGKSNE